MSKKQKGLSNFTTPKFHLTNRQNAAKTFARCPLKTGQFGKSWQFGSVWSLSQIQKRDEPAFWRDYGALREESTTDLKFICCNGFTDLRGGQRVAYEYSGFCEILRR
jgi:hypothetical protein